MKRTSFNENRRRENELKLIQLTDDLMRFCQSSIMVAEHDMPFSDLMDSMGQAIERLLELQKRAKALDELADNEEYEHVREYVLHVIKQLLKEYRLAEKTADIMTTQLHYRLIAVGKTSVSGYKDLKRHHDVLTRELAESVD